MVFYFLFLFPPLPIHPLCFYIGTHVQKDRLGSVSLKTEQVPSGEEHGLVHLVFLLVSEVKPSQTRMTAVNLKCSCVLFFWKY